MTQTDNILTPAPGKMLTQAADVDMSARIVTSAVHLAVNDIPANWREITAEEATAIRTQQELLLLQEQSVITPTTI